MFTPPPSPNPPRPYYDPACSDECDSEMALSPSSPPSPAALKRVVGRRTRWAVILVPLALLLITASTRYIAHPHAFDALLSSDPTVSWADWSLHKRHQSEPVLSLRALNIVDAETAAAVASSSDASIVLFPTSAASSTPSASTTATASSTLPTVPASAPVLPTPFPQPLDTLTQNFSSQACYNFFLNMTQSDAFRYCRPFSLLLQSSSEFIEQAEKNTTYLNEILWGTCNTQDELDTCVDNMAWFVSDLESVCSQDLSERNQVVTSTLLGLQAFPLMHQTGCLTDPSTNTYCFVDATFNSNPSDYYYYQLPLGLAVPNTTTPSCSSCTQSLLAMYVPNVKNLSGLTDTYESAAKLAQDTCGTGYAVVQASAGASVSSAAVDALGLGDRMASWVWAVLLSVVVTIVVG